MNKNIIELWDCAKKDIESRLRHTEQKEYDSYEKLLKIILQEMNKSVEAVEGIHDIFSSEHISVIDYGDYQGTLMFVFPLRTYQPTADETYYTIIEYGSCSGCDTLLGINDDGFDEGLPNEGQIKEYMMLCLNMVQNMQTFKQIEGADF